MTRLDEQGPEKSDILGRPIQVDGEAKVGHDSQDPELVERFGQPFRTLVDRKRLASCGFCTSPAGYECGMAELLSRCPVCGARVNAQTGTPTPPHQIEGTQTECSGTGQPSN
jgi:hypothetical protein